MHFHRRCITVLVAAVLLASVSLFATGCDAEGPDPLLESREALGTVVSVTAYPAEGAHEDEVRAGIDLAYVKMARVEAALDAHDPRSAIAKINAAAGGTLPPEALEVLEARERLEVAEQFSPFLLEVAKLYDFEGTGTVPTAQTLGRYVAGARAWLVHDGRAEFVPGILSSSDPGPAGLDFGGAAKGLALDRALAALALGSNERRNSTGAALVTAGSTTVTFGIKPDGEPWRIGVEDPRDPEAVIATVEADGDVAVSTSGDYQRYFERDGVRYHHILDPRSGAPARGLRSLTVVGAVPGLDSDILSTALFVMGAERAATYAEEHGLGLVLVDDEGRVRIVPGPDDSSWRIYSPM